jgi:hypothetical protein
VGATTEGGGRGRGRTVARRRTGDAAPSAGREAARNQHRPSTSAHLLSPILVVAERVDRRRRHIRPVHADALIGVELRRHDGPTVRLRRGAVVRPGDPIAEVHLRNERVRAAATARGWVAIYRARGDLEALLRWCARQPETTRPVAVHAYSLLGAFLERAGFERRPRRQTLRTRVDAWFMRWLMGHYSPAGEARLRVGHGPLEAADYWLPVPGRAPTETSPGA